MRPLSRLLLLVLTPFILFYAYTRYPGSGFDIDLDIDLARYNPKNGYTWLQSGAGAGFASCGPCGKDTTEFCEMMGYVVVVVPKILTLQTGGYG
jgi:hypothetical protein